MRRNKTSLRISTLSDSPFVKLPFVCLKVPPRLPLPREALSSMSDDEAVFSVCFETTELLKTPHQTHQTHQNLMQPRKRDTNRSDSGMTTTAASPFHPTPAKPSTSSPYDPKFASKANSSATSINR